METASARKPRVRAPTPVEPTSSIVVHAVGASACTPSTAHAPSAPRCRQPSCRKAALAAHHIFPQARVCARCSGWRSHSSHPRPPGGLYGLACSPMRQNVRGRARLARRSLESGAVSEHCRLQPLFAAIAAHPGRATTRQHMWASLWRALHSGTRVCAVASCSPQIPPACPATSLLNARLRHSDRHSTRAPRAVAARRLRAEHLSNHNSASLTTVPWRRRRRRQAA